jgi:heptaprenyl diphosphate synthase
VTQPHLGDAYPCLAGDVERVQAGLRASGRVEGRPDLTGMVGHLLDGIPKLVRPTLVLTAAYLCGDPTKPVSERVIDAAVAIEHVHVGTMCHDDVMDDADTRRARPSVNARWGNAQAILSGDFHLARAAEIAAGLGLDACEVVAHTFRELCQGQMIETADLYSVARVEDAYLRAITGKTATLLSSSCRMGALHAAAGDDVVAALAGFGLQFGVAFQIHDDVLDLTESSEKLGKPAGNDIPAGVYTLPVIRALPRQPELRELLSGSVSPPAAARARRLVLESGSIEEAVAVGRDRFRRAVEALRLVRRHPAQVEALVAFAAEMLPAFGALAASATPT